MKLITQTAYVPCSWKPKNNFMIHPSNPLGSCYVEPKENSIVLSKKELVELITYTWDEAINTPVPNDNDKKSFINNLLNQQ